MFVSAVSRRNIHKWHAIDRSTIRGANYMTLLNTAACGAPVINPTTDRTFSAHSLGEDIGARFDSRCQSCLRIVRKAQKGITS